MKNINEINALLDKYWECETTVAEENMLKQYFSNSDVAEELKAYIPYFQPLNDIGQISSNIQLEDTMPKAKVISMFVKKYMYAAAAILTLGLCSLWLINNNTNNSRQMAEVNDPQEALRITTDALAMLSKKMNVGTEILQENIHHVQRVNIIK